MTYKRYENYKDSGSEWIGDVPIHWYEKKLKYFVETIKGFAFKSEVFRDRGVPIIKTTDIKQGGIVNPITFINENDINDYTNVMLKENDILMSTVGSKPEVINSAVGQIGLVSREYEGSLLNQNAVILRPKTKDINNKLLFYYLSSNNYRKYLDLNAHGTANQSSLTLKEILDFTIVIPDIIEQNQIADYLDKKTTEIDSLIQDKENLIELLKEQRQAIITETVTKGLDNNVSMKDSGVDWIGEIPEHWDVSRLKHIADIEISNVDKKTVDGEKAVLLCNYTDVYYNNVINSEMEFMKATAKDDQITKFTLKYQDVMITKDSESPLDIGVPAWVEEDLNGVLCGYHMAHIRCRDNVSGKYIYYSMLANGIRDQYYSTANGVTRFGLGKDSIRNSIFFIPNIKEQEEIINFLDRKTIEIDSLISDVKVGIKNLKDYKQSLISEVVTGKIDIREL